jgi:flagellar hook-associated protein 1
MASISLNTGIKALLAAQSGLDTVGHNVSNANTPGYSREELLVSASRTQIVRGLAVGGGVDTERVSRTVDALLHRRLTAQEGTLARLDARVTGLNQIETLLGEPGSNALSDRVQKLFSNLSSLAANPADATLRKTVVIAANDMTTQLHALSESIGAVSTDAGAQIKAQTVAVNQLTTNIANLNVQINDFESTGMPANDLRDQRELSIRELGKYVNVTQNENSSGAVTVTSSGQLLVGPTRSYELTAHDLPGGGVELRVAGHANAMHPKNGSLAGLVEIAQQIGPQGLAKLDQFAKGFVFEMNRAHSTGVPQGGSFHTLQSAFAFSDVDGDGQILDEPIGGASKEFPISKGDLYVNVVDEASGAVSTTRVAIDPNTTSVKGLIDKLDNIAHISASLDDTGHLSISSESGYAFDFSRRLESAPDSEGAFGGKAASIGSTTAEPFALADAQTMQIVGPTGTLAVTFSASSFDNIGHASAAEVANAINATPGAFASGVRAVEVDGNLVIQSLAGGTGQTLSIGGGTAVGALGFTAGQSTTGQLHAVDMQISGTYTGNVNETYSFRPNMDGTIGTTPGLKVDVFDSTGSKVKTLDVGADYQPGTALSFGVGLSASFGLGDISATDHDVSTLHTLADSDTSDVLAALGVNAMFTGTKASDIEINGNIADNPANLSSSATGVAGDNGILHEILDSQSATHASLGGETFETFYANVVAGIGAENASSKSAQDTENALMSSLTARREEISGVNVDEEMVNMMRYQQSYQAAAQYIQVVNQTVDDLLRII